MTDLRDLIAPAGVVFGLAVAGKKQLFGALATRASSLYGFGADEIAARLGARERNGVTGFGGGAAIPHARLPVCPRPLALIARLAAPIDYEALDGAPVDLAVLLLSGERDGPTHLKTLARLSRVLRDTVLVAKLRGAASADALYALLGPPAQSRAA